MYDNETVPTAEHGDILRPVVDPAVFSDFIFSGPPVPGGKHSPVEIDPTQVARHAAPHEAQSPDDGIRITPKGKVQPEAPKTPDWYDLHQGAPKVAPMNEDSAAMSRLLRADGASNEDRKRFLDWTREVRSDLKSVSDSAKNLKTGEEALKTYIKEIPKLVEAAAANRETAFELQAALKGSSLIATETFAKDTPVYSSFLETALVFQQKGADWELHVNQRTGAVTATRFDERTKKMEPTQAGPVLEHVGMTLRAALAVKCFRDGDVEEGRAQLQSLLEDGQKLEAGEKLKKIINAEADLIYKPARLRAVTRDDFNRILSETERSVSQSKKKR